MVRQCIKQCEEKRDGQCEDKKRRQVGKAKFQRVQKVQLGLAHLIKPGKKEERDPKYHEAAQAGGQGREQFAKKVSVVQPHGAG